MKPRRRRYLQARAAVRLGSELTWRDDKHGATVWIDGVLVGKVSTAEVNKLVKLAHKRKRARLPTGMRGIDSKNRNGRWKSGAYVNPPYSDAPKTFKQ